MKLLNNFIIINILTLSNANAYIDPGSTSLFFQTLLAALAGGFAWIIIYYKKLKYFLKELFEKKFKKKI
jgi:hypothetical protein